MPVPHAKRRLAKRTMIWIAVAVGGSLGAVLRFAISRSAVTAFGTAFPWGTLIANAVGAFAIGFLFAWFSHRLSVTPAVRALIMTGLLGALTTFSTFSLETLELLHGGEMVRAGLNVAANLGLALVLVWGGYVLGGRL
ncbi:MAG: fluoride efflux transporter CrcB [Gammaproteobacteria bacterium]